MPKWGFSLSSQIFSSAKRELVYIIIGVLVLILIAVNEVHHFIIGSVTLRDTHLLTPLGNSILASVKDVLTSILERLARRTHTAFLWEEALLVMDIENVASTFYLTITDGKFSTKNFVQFIKELLTGRPCTLVSKDNKQMSSSASNSAQ